MLHLGLDAGNGAFKIHGPQGGLETLSQVARNWTRLWREPLARAVRLHAVYALGSPNVDCVRPNSNLKGTLRA